VYTLITKSFGEKTFGQISIQSFFRTNKAKQLEINEKGNKKIKQMRSLRK